MRGCQPLLLDEVIAAMYAMRGRLVLRNRALLMVGCLTGLRIHELLSLDFADVQSPGGVFVRQVLVQRRNMKGCFAGRVVPLLEDTHQPLRLWMAEARSEYGARQDWPLFCTRSGSRLCLAQAGRVLRCAFVAAGLGLATPGTHTMRKTYVKYVWEHLVRRRAAGEDIEPLTMLQQATGHRSMNSVTAYLDTMGMSVLSSIEAVGRQFGAALKRGPPSPVLPTGPQTGVADGTETARCV